MKKSRFRSVDTPKRSGRTNEKIAGNSVDTQKGSDATDEKIAKNVAANPQKWSGVINEKKCTDTSVDTRKWLGADNEKKSRNIPGVTQETSDSTSQKIARNMPQAKKASDTFNVTPMGDPLMKKARDIAFSTQNGGPTNEKKARDIAIDTQKWGVTNEKKARPISVFTQKWGVTNEQKASNIPVVTPRRQATNEKRVKDISDDTKKVADSLMKKARVISVVTQKGGVGKTATAINMSVGLHNLGYKVAAIDLDPQGQLAEGFGIRRKSLKKTMLDVLLGMAHMKDIKKKAYGVDLYLSNRSLADLGAAVQTPSNFELYPDPNVLLKQALAQIDTKYDFIIIDTPPTVSIFNTNALNASTDAVIPMQPEGMAVKGAEDMIEFIREVQKSSNNKLNILGILATMVQNTNLHNTVMQEVRKSFIKSDITVFDTVIKRTIRYGSAQTEGVPDTKSFPEYTEFLKEALFGETA